MANRWRYYQYLNINVQKLPPNAQDHFLTYDEEEDDELHYFGGENILMPVVRREDYGKSSLLTGIFNLTTTIVGGGTLSIPYALAAAGVVLGSLMIVVIAFFSFLSAHLLIKLSKLCNQPSYKVNK